uniref:G-protein coupled receptors family 1 profile domain-containing protein n=1 Tax=Glossina brevipalpis TaxID=37001 RepID=A0A1A9W3D6_9MUSC
MLNITKGKPLPHWQQLWHVFVVHNITGIALLLNFCSLTQAINKQTITETAAIIELTSTSFITIERENEKVNNYNGGIVLNEYPVDNTATANVTAYWKRERKQNFFDKAFMWPDNNLTNSDIITTLLPFKVAVTETVSTPIVISTDLITFEEIEEMREKESINTNISLTGGQKKLLLNMHQECVENRNALAHILTIVMYSIVCVLGLLGNTLVIWVVLRFSKMQTVTNIYILNLAIADECFLIGIPFLLYTMRICSWKFSEYVCKAYMVSTSITQFTSSIFLLIMAADRYIAVCHPIESPRYRTLRIAKWVTLIAWFTSVILMLPVILFATTIRQEDGIHYTCNIDWPEMYRNHSGVTFILYTFLLGFAIPLSFILIFYVLVIRKLHTVQKKHKSKEKKKSHRKVTRLVLIVITVYTLCWLPHWISQVSLVLTYVTHRELTSFEILLILIFGCLAYSNSAMNPILYAFLSDNFRKSFSKAFSCVSKQEVEAQLFNEHSAFTHKRTGSGSWRRGSRRMSAQQRNMPLQSTNTFLAVTAVNNCIGNSSSGNSASTTTTTADKSSTSTGTEAKVCSEKNSDFNVTIETEKIVLAVNHAETGKQKIYDGKETI